MKIAVDAMGGDYAPAAIVEGAVWAARDTGIPIILTGDRERVESELSRCDADGLPINVVHASEVIGMEESPAQAMRKKKDSSVRVCFDLVKGGEAGAVVSAGNSGAAMAAAIFVLKRLNGVERPAISVCLPTVKEWTILLDAGGNVDCKPVHLYQFAVMGDVYARDILKKSSPRIGLLSNGEEEGKGNELTRETNDLLKTSRLNYLGYVEGRDVFTGDVDVVVCDGFIGNVVLKLSEGVADAIIAMLKREIQKSLPAKMGYLLARGVFKDLKRKIDYSEYGGAPLLGINGTCIISHGGSTAKAIKNAIVRANDYATRHVNRHMIEKLREDAVLSGDGEVGSLTTGKQSGAR
ncbi:MAG: phosphate acyltransferase PlsX [Thermodesulfobacteriota bacterium]